MESKLANWREFNHSWNLVSRKRGSKETLAGVRNIFGAADLAVAAKASKLI